MDDDRSDARTRPTSRRHALRLLAGGALGGALALGAQHAVGAVTARPALPKNWTHLAGTTTGIFFYRPGGIGVSGTFGDGLFTRAARYETFNPDWTHIIGANRSLFFYRASDGLVATGYLDAAGAWVFPTGATAQFSARATPFPGTRSGRFVFYNPGLLFPHSLTADGFVADNDRAPDDVGPGWTTMAGAGFNTYLLYRDDGQARTGRIEGSNAGGTPVYRWVSGRTYTFASGWTHVAGTFNGGLLFLRQRDGFGATGYLDAAGDFHQTGNPSFGRGWTHLVGAGSRSLLFYSKHTGKGLGGFMTAAGVWTPTTTYGA